MNTAWHGLVVVLWFCASLINWCFVIGYQNKQFQKYRKFSEPIFWLVLSTLFSGFGGLISSIFIGRCKYFSIRPLSKSKQEQIVMLWKLEQSERESIGEQASGYAANAQTHAGVGRGGMTIL